MQTLLQISNLSAAYDANWQRPVWRGLYLRLAAGGVLCVWGPNGAGRSTLAKAVKGLVPSRGQIDWLGESIANSAVDERARLGLAYVPETREVFTYLSAFENLQLGLAQGLWAHSVSSKSKHAKNAAQFDYTLEQVWHDFPALFRRRNAMAGVLSGGEQQMLSLARALLAKPQCLVLDEVSEGLSPQMVEATLGVLHQAKKAGVALLMMEQKAVFARELGGEAVQIEDLCRAKAD